MTSGLRADGGSAYSPVEIGAALDALRSPFKAVDQAVFASDLTVGELILLEEIGYEAVEIVSGAGSASWYPQFTTAGTEGRMWSHAIAAAISEARATIDAEVTHFRADGVVAMRLELEREPANLLTCTMLGTAVRHTTARGGHHAAASKSGHAAGVFTTTLSASDFHLITRAGYRPAGIVIGASVVGFNARSASQALGLSRDNLELEGQTNALYSAREQAMEMMEREALALKADGVVAVRLSERPMNTMLTHAVELIVIGTAVYRGSEGHKSVDPKMQLTLNDSEPEVFGGG